MTTKISTLPSLATVTDVTIIPVVEGGATKRITGLALKTYTGTASGPQGPSGPSGANGSAGSAGATGPQGPSGPSGPGTLNSGTAGYVPYYSGSTALSAPTSGNLFWDNNNARLGIGTASPAVSVEISKSSGEALRLSATGANQNIYSRYITGSPGAGNVYVGVDSAAGGLTGIGNAGHIWNAGNAGVVIGTNNNLRVVVDESGNFIIGNTTARPQTGNSSSSVPAGNSRLVVDYSNLATGSNSTAFNNSTFALLVTGNANGNNSTTSGCLIGTNYTTGATDPPDHFRAHYTGNFGTSSAPVFRIAYNGNTTNTNNSYGAVSDSRLKQQITNAGSQWQDIKNIQIRKYKLNSAVEAMGNDAAPFHIGVVAQELEASNMPGLVTVEADEEQTRSVKYSVLYIKAVKALQEAMDRIEQLEARLAAANL